MENDKRDPEREEQVDDFEGPVAGGWSDQVQEVLEQVRPTVRAAIEAGDPTALQKVLVALPEPEADAIVQQLEAAGIIRREPRPEMAEVLDKFEPLLRAIAYVALAEESEEERARVEAALADVEAMGWQLAQPARRIWRGERDEEVLTDGIDANTAWLVRRLLVLVG